MYLVIRSVKQPIIYKKELIGKKIDLVSLNTRLDTISFKIIGNQTPAHLAHKINS